MATAPEQLIEITSRHQVHLERLKAGEVKQIAGFLTDMDESVRTRLAGKDITEYTRKRLETLLERINEDLSAIVLAMQGAIVAQAVDLAIYESDFEIRSLNQIIDRDFVRPTPTQLRAAVKLNPLSLPDTRYGGMMLEPFIKDAMRPGVERVTAAIRSGYYQGQTTNQILQAVRGTKAAAYTDGIWPGISREAEAVVRTSLQHAATQARMETFEQNSDIIKGVRWNATLERRTCAVCGALDGQVFALNKGPRPPLHPNCRCSLTATLDDRYNFLDDGATRFSRGPDGVESVDADLSFYGWLKKQPRDFVDSAIGPTRAKLLLEGNLSAQRFAELNLGKRFEPLSLATMRELDPVSFIRAGIDKPQ